MLQFDIADYEHARKSLFGSSRCFSWYSGPQDGPVTVSDLVLMGGGVEIPLLQAFITEIHNRMVYIDIKYVFTYSYVII